MSVNPTTDDQQPADNGDEHQAKSDVDVEAVADAVAEACADSAESSIDEQLAAEKDRVMRLQAEMENLRSRTAREILDERRYGAMALLRDLLPASDNIDRAIEAAEQNEESASLLEGFKLVKQQLLTIFEQHQCKPIEALGQPFDPQIHEAILQQPSDEQPANHVMMVTQIGYQLHDRVVRPSQVIVSTGPAQEVAGEEA